MLLASILMNPSSNKAKPNTIDLKKNLCIVVKKTL